MFFSYYSYLLCIALFFFAFSPSQIQAGHRGDAIDIIIAAIKKRLGVALRRVEKLPEFGPYLAATDADAVAWCLQEVGASVSVDGGAINVPSSRHLAVRLSTMLREASTAVVESGTIADSSAERSPQQLDHCGALLAVCDALIKFEESSNDDW